MATGTNETIVVTLYPDILTTETVHREISLRLSIDNTPNMLKQKGQLQMIKNVIYLRSRLPFQGGTLRPDMNEAEIEIA
jgi:hypothetical protein